MMQAWVLRDYGSLTLEERPMPEAPGLLLRVVATGLCGSDLSVFKGTPAMRARWRPPLILGHEVAGVVEEGPGELLGRAVAVHPAISCKTCPACRKGQPHLCPNRTHLGFHLPGGLAQWIRVPEGQAYPLPENIPPWKGALAEPLAVVLHGITLGRPEPGEEALVLGGGALGGLAAWLLGRLGLRVSLCEPNPVRKEVFRRLGLAEVLEEEPLPEGRFPLVLDTVGLEATFPQALRACAPGGRVVVLGLGEMETHLALQDLVLREKQVLGSYLFTPKEFAEAVNLLKDLPEALVRRWPATEAQAAFSALVQGLVPEPKLVLVW